MIYEQYFVCVLDGTTFIHTLLGFILLIVILVVIMLLDILKIVIEVIYEQLMDTIDKVILLIEGDLQKRYAHLLDVYDGIISFELCDSEITELAHFFT